MAHRYTKDDVRKAFERYQELTNDQRASLQIWSPGDSHGTRYQVINSLTSLDRRRVMLGAESAWTAIHSYCDGWQDAMRLATRGRETFSADDTLESA